MKRWGWAAVAAFCLSVSAGAILQRFAAGEAPARVSLRQAIHRHYHCQPYHWRSCLLQH